MLFVLTFFLSCWELFVLNFGDVVFLERKKEQEVDKEVRRIRIELGKRKKT